MLDCRLLHCLCESYGNLKLAADDLRSHDSEGHDDIS